MNAKCKTVVEIIIFFAKVYLCSPDLKMDSSPDLSLKLRRGSNDSRDSYYMDFAQGIDSDIEEVETVTAAPGNIEITSDSSDSQPPAVLPTTDLDSDEKDEPELVIDEPLPPTPPPPPILESIPSIPIISSVPTIPTIPIIPSGPLISSTVTNSAENSTTDEDDDISQITPLPMPILPPLKTDLLQMMPPKIPLVDDDEG